MADSWGEVIVAMSILAQAVFSDFERFILEISG